ncbi:hypothetical protein MKW98_024425 [Papaver atlanticum]|uniref:Pre-mRNA-splicing factor SLU7 n=1 Tax=Papaver atlanticum TaxID=357466 RepID=A0AAD4T0N1_9MAGN|nr:hypothetical protein MKW98_024425 [Papaver atlanticum]
MTKRRWPFRGGSKYKEDIYTGNHTTVWGSWWKNQWGYKCCQQVTRNSYCTRTAGAEVVESTTDLIEADAASHQKQRRPVRFVDFKAFIARRRGVVAREAGLPPAELGAIVLRCMYEEVQDAFYDALLDVALHQSSIFEEVEFSNWLIWITRIVFQRIVVVEVFTIQILAHNIGNLCIFII